MPLYLYPWTPRTYLYDMACTMNACSRDSLHKVDKKMKNMSRETCKVKYKVYMNHKHMVEMKVVHGNTVVVVGHKKYMVKLEGSTWIIWRWIIRILWLCYEIPWIIHDEYVCKTNQQVYENKLSFQSHNNDVPIQSNQRKQKIKAQNKRWNEITQTSYWVPSCL